MGKRTLDHDRYAPQDVPVPVMTGPGVPSQDQGGQLPGWQAFDMPISRSGFAVDRRGFTRLFMEQAAANTNLLIAEAGLKPVVRFNHPDLCDPNGESPTGGGILTRLWTAPAADAPEEVVLWARCSLWGSVLESQLAGTSPQRSIGWTPEGMNTGGMMVGHYVDHLAFLPNQGAAMPGLDEQAKAALSAAGDPPRHWLMKVVDTMRSLVGRFERAQGAGHARTMAVNPGGDRSDPQELAMTPEECKQLADMAVALSALAEKYMVEEPPAGDEPPPPDGEEGAAAAAKPPPPASAPSAAAAERDILLRDAADRRFASLVESGHAKPDQRKQFDSLARGHGGGLAGVQKAEQFFLGLKPEKAPAGELPAGEHDLARMSAEANADATLRGAFGVNMFRDDLPVGGK